MHQIATGRISEIFTSLQGEGPYCGCEQTFIRFYGCNLACGFCDTKGSSFADFSLDEVLVKIMHEGHKGFFSITGGEPLLQARFLSRLLKELKNQKFKIYLETNGTLVSELSFLIDLIDIVAMDFKLPSSTGLKSYFSEHKEFLQLARKKETFIKAVITADTSFEDVQTAVDIIKAQDKNIPFVLQPDTNQLSNNLFKKISDLRSFALEHLSTVRLIPQMHKIAGLR